MYSVYHTSLNRRHTETDLIQLKDVVRCSRKTFDLRFLMSYIVNEETFAGFR